MQILDINVTFVPKSGCCTVKSEKLGVRFPYPKYAIVIPGASCVITWCLSFSEAFDISVPSYFL